MNMFCVTFSLAINVDFCQEKHLQPLQFLLYFIYYYFVDYFMAENINF